MVAVRGKMGRALSLRAMQWHPQRRRRLGGEFLVAATARPWLPSPHARSDPRRRTGVPVRFARGRRRLLRKNGGDTATTASRSRWPGRRSNTPPTWSIRATPSTCSTATTTDSICAARAAPEPITFIADGSNVGIVSDNDTTPDASTSRTRRTSSSTDSSSTTALAPASASPFPSFSQCGTAAPETTESGGSSPASSTTSSSEHENVRLDRRAGIYRLEQRRPPDHPRQPFARQLRQRLHMNATRAEAAATARSPTRWSRTTHPRQRRERRLGHQHGRRGRQRLRNNLLFDNHASGISLYRIDGATRRDRESRLHNTIITPPTPLVLQNHNGSTGNHVLNNMPSTTCTTGARRDLHDTRAAPGSSRTTTA